MAIATATSRRRRVGVHVQRPRGDAQQSRARQVPGIPFIGGKRDAPYRRGTRTLLTYMRSKIHTSPVRQQQLCACADSAHRRRRGGAFISSLHGVPPAFARALRLEALLATLGWAALATLAAAEVEVVRRFLRVLLRATTNGPISELLVPRGASHFGAVGFAALGRPVCDRVLDGNIEVVVDGFVEYVFVFWIARSAAGTTWEATAGKRAAGR